MSKKRTNSQILITEIINQNFEDFPNINKEDDFFEFFSAILYLKQYDLSDEDIEKGIVGSSLDGGCDSIFLFINEEIINLDDDLLVESIIKEHNKKKISIPLDMKLIIIQSKNSFSFNENVLNKWKTMSKNLLDISVNNRYSKRYSNLLISKTQNFKKLYKKLVSKSPNLTIEFAYISKGDDIHPNVKSQGDELTAEIKQLYPSSKTTISVTYTGALELMNIYDEPLKVPFNLMFANDPITILSEKEYIGLVSLKDYYTFISHPKSKKLIKHIFESNVRDYQGNVAVNKDIQDTLSTNDNEFWWVNNGITILATEIDQATSRSLVLKDPAIVNGLQTSREIFNYFNNLDDSIKIKDDRKVMVKIMVPRNEVVRDKIILATNNQTSIPKSSLRGTDSIHREIEHYLKSRNLFYDRRKNYYKNEGKKSHEIVTLSFLAQCLFSIILKKPDYARARPSTLLNDDKTYKKVYNDDVELETYYHAAYIGMTIKQILSKENIYPIAIQTDILFYVIFVYVALKNSNYTITTDDLANNINTDIETEEVLFIAKKVHELYKELGGTNKIAKGTSLITKILDTNLKSFSKNSKKEAAKQ